MSTLKLYLLGPPHIEINAQPVTFDRRKSLALLAYLVVSGKSEQRNTLATLLWPDCAQGHARGLLRRELSSLRRTLGGNWLSTSGDQITLPQDERLWVDAWVFKALLQTAVHNLAARNTDGHNTAHLTDLTHAVELYRGDFLAGFTLSDSPDFDDWQFLQAEEYRRSLQQALDLLVEGYSRQGEWDLALEHARRRLALDPLYEPTQRALMRLYAENGQTAAALRQYEECVHVLERELGVSPDVETTDLYEAIRNRHFPPSNRRPAVANGPVLVAKHNLPVQLTSFVGREDDVAAVLERLRTPACRLLTIVGAGGAGKTRLALAVAEQAVEHFATVCFAPLTGVDTPSALPAAIADALLLPPTTGNAGRREHLLNYLRQQEMLLVLDNFEHLVEGVGFLSEMLATAPDVKLLVTSRQSLDLHEEWRYPLGGLAFPASDEPTFGAAYPAVELFRQRAEQTDPEFSLTEQTAAVTALCRRLEGLPLGIELAAALTRVLSAAEINKELDSNLDVLSTTARNIPAQHRSLRAVFEHSWRLLPPQTQEALRTLSIFRSTFDRNAALAVAGLTLAELSNLVDRSLVRRLPDDRYDLHALMRQFLAEKLSATPGKQDAAGHRHCRHFCARLSRMAWGFEPEKEPGGFTYVSFVQRFSADVDSYRAAWRWAVNHVDLEAIRQAMDPFVEFFAVEEGRHLFDEAVTAVQAAEDIPFVEREALTASLLLRRSYFWRWDRLPQSAEVLAHSLAVLRRSDPDNYVDISASLIWLGITIASLGRNDEGATLIDEGIGLFRDHDHYAGMAWGLNFRGLLEAGRGRLAPARSFLEQSMTLFESCKNWRWQAIARSNLADVALLQGDFAWARSLYEQSLAEEEIAARPELVKTLGESYAALGELERAEACFAEAEALYARAGMPYGMSLAYTVTPGVLARLQGDLAEAERLLVGSVVIAQQVGFDQRISTNLHNLARLRHDQQRYEEAISLLNEALTTARRIDFRFATALVLCQLGHSATALDKPEAPAYYTESLQIALEDEIDRVATDAVGGMAKRLATDGRLDEAVSLLALVVDHPASDYETRQKAQALLAELSAELPPERLALALYQGRHTTLHQAVAQLLQSECQPPERQTASSA